MSSEDASPNASVPSAEHTQREMTRTEEITHVGSGWSLSEDNTLTNSGKQQQQPQRYWASPPSSICTVPSTAAVYRNSEDNDDNYSDNDDEDSLDSRQNNDRESVSGSVSDAESLPSRASFASQHEREMLAPLQPLQQPQPHTHTQGEREKERGAQRKRSRRSQLGDDAALDDILGQITSRMTHLSTNDARSSHDHGVVSAFIEVLQCSPSEAEFFLESSAWDMQTAVLLYLENNPHSLSQFEREREMASRSHNSNNNNNNNNLYNPLYNPHHTHNGHCDNSNAQLDALHGGSQHPASSSFVYPRSMRPVQKRWRRRGVAIQDLPTDWEARVSAYEGVVYFVHRPSGRTQKTVPPGFADLDSPPSSSSSAVMSSSSMNGSPRAMESHTQPHDTIPQHINVFDNNGSNNMENDHNNNGEDWASACMISGPSPPSLSPAVQPTSFCTAMEESEMVEDYDALAKLWGRKEDASGSRTEERT